MSIVSATSPSTPERRYIRAVSLIGLAQMVEAAGKDFGVFLDQVGIEHIALSDLDAYVSSQKFGTLLELIASDLHQPSFGLAWAKRMAPHFPNLGPVMLAAGKARTIREWIEMIEPYWHCHTNAYRPRRIRLSGTSHVACRFEFDPSVVVRRQKIEYIFAEVSLLVRVLTGISDKRHLMVRFKHGEPGDRSLYEEIFMCPVEFNAEHNEIVFDDRNLDLPIVYSDAQLRAAVDAHVWERVSRQPAFDGTAKSRVGAAIRCMLGVGITNMETVAKSMGLSSKTLQRRLADQGTSYVQILEGIRRTEAIRLLSQTRVPVFRVAAILDYASAPPFNLAFGRWKGCSPNEFRKAALSPSAIEPID